MADIKPFSCIRPRKELAARVAALPYDVYSRKEAKKETGKEPLSFLHIDRPETQFDDSVDMYSIPVYEKARQLLYSRINDGTLIRDGEECYYVYELTMDGRSQAGIVACASIDDYLNGIIKKHENTREEKEQDRIRHVDYCNAQTGPIFLAYRTEPALKVMISNAREQEPIYDFAAPDGVRHKVFRIHSLQEIALIRESFLGIKSIYIADGHHRAASAVKVGLMRRERAGGYQGTEEFNYFLSVLFPEEELNIMPYNRAVRDLNGRTKAEFLSLLAESFVVKKEEKPYAPEKKGKFGMYFDGTWYSLVFQKKKQESDLVAELDVSILQNYLLKPILGIYDPRTDERIDFIGGIRGLTELERRVQTDRKVAFSLFPTSIQELFAVSDAGMLMPPKSTWFEPKLRSGLFVHEF